MVSGRAQPNAASRLLPEAARAIVAALSELGSHSFEKTPEASQARLLSGLVSVAAEVQGYAVKQMPRHFQGIVA